MVLKSFVCFLTLLVSVSAIQPQNVVWSEDFENGFPANMTRIDNDGLGYQGSISYPLGWKIESNWSPFMYFCASQIFGEAGMKVKKKQGDSIVVSTSWYDPAGSASDWLITPQLTVPADGYICFQVLGMNSFSLLNFSFDKYDVKISTTGNSVNDFSTILLDTYAPPEWRRFCADLSAYAGQQVYIAFVNDTYTNRFVFLDELELLQRFIRDAGVKPQFDSTWAAAGLASYPRGIVTNFGTLTITSMDINYSYDNGAAITQSISGINIGLQDTFSFVHSTPIVPPSTGFKTLKMWVSNINGGADQLNTNDTGNAIIQVLEKATQRTSLLEIHSGDDCGPCHNLNGVLAPVIDAWEANSATGNICQLEYQTYVNDPSDNADATARSNRYGISGYPTENINGKDPDGISWYAADDQYHIFTDYRQTWFSNQLAYIEMDVSLSISGNTATVTVGVNPLINYSVSTLRLFIAIAEKEYIWTGGLSGQTDYHHILRKMLPDANGIALGSLTAGSPLTFVQSYTFTIGNVTEGSFNLWVGMNNIEAVAFIQDDLTDVVEQSAARNASDPVIGISDARQAVNVISVFPNPCSDFLNVGIGLETGRNLQLEIMGLDGKTIMKSTAAGQLAGMNHIILNVSDLPAGCYVLKIYSDDGVMVGASKFIRKG